MNRILGAVAAAAMILSPLAGPALAGPAEDAFLAKLVGTWTGTGSIKGGIDGSMSCSLKFRAISDGVHFSGNCDVEGIGGQSFSGDLSYNDKAGRYEAHSPGGEVTVGTGRGKSIAFVSKLRGLAGTGTSTMTLTASKISIDTDIVDSQSNKPSKSHVTFTK